MRQPRVLLLAVVASVLAGLGVASAAVLAVNGGTLAVYTFAVKLAPTPPVLKGGAPRCEPPVAQVRFTDATPAAYPPGALGSASAAAARTASDLQAAANPQACPPGPPGPPARFVEPQLRPSPGTPTPVPSGGGRFLGPPAKR